MLLTGTDRDRIEITTPAGKPYDAELLDRVIREGYASCGVQKDGGDDPDVTTGLVIMARAERDMGIQEEAGAREEDGAREEAGAGKDAKARKEAGAGQGSEGKLPDPTTSKARICGKEGSGRVRICGKEESGRVRICGGEGVGRVTEPGLDQPVGEAAINHVPREMITREVTEVMDLLDEPGPIRITIFVPGGEECAKKTFNPRLGILGGISIIGTSGLVEPMSEKALVDTIRLELRQRYLKGQEIAVVTPGNYGMDMLKKAYDYDLDRAVKCSNFIGDTIDMAAEEGYRRMVLMGHMGKLVKCAGGVMNTHSRYGDRRMELLSAAAERIGIPQNTVEGIRGCVSTEAALGLLSEEQGKEVSREILEEALAHLRKKAKGRIAVEMILYTNVQGILAESEAAVQWLAESTAVV